MITVVAGGFLSRPFLNYPICQVNESAFNPCPPYSNCVNSLDPEYSAHYVEPILFPKNLSNDRIDRAIKQALENIHQATSFKHNFFGKPILEVCGTKNKYQVILRYYFWGEEKWRIKKSRVKIDIKLQTESYGGLHREHERILRSELEYSLKVAEAEAKAAHEIKQAYCRKGGGLFYHECMDQRV